MNACDKLGMTDEGRFLACTLERGHEEGCVVARPLTPRQVFQYVVRLEHENEVMEKAIRYIDSWGGPGDETSTATVALKYLEEIRRRR